ncbi:MAG: aminopeptidase [Nanoarchaeota archaeon]
MDPRTKQLAKLLVNYSLDVKPNEKVIINGDIEAKEFIEALYKEVILKGAHPIIKVNLSNLNHFFYKYANKNQLERFPEEWFNTVKGAQKYIGILTEANTKELSNIDPKKIISRQKITAPISHYIVNSKPQMVRCTVGFPCNALAQEANMSLDEYKDFVFSACLQDWKKLGKKLDKVKAKFKKNSHVHLIGENIDLKFNVHGDKAIASKGMENMPDGEVFMAPVRESVNGWVRFEYPAIRNGKEVTGIFLRFKEGKVIEAKADKNQDFLIQMLTTDANSSYLGEFGIGGNPKVTKFTGELLYDEKISGTIHLALGMAYKENGGGNDSAIHWDIVKDMKNAKIIVDNKRIQENGLWKI